MVQFILTLPPLSAIFYFACTIAAVIAYLGCNLLTFIVGVVMHDIVLFAVSCRGETLGDGIDVLCYRDYTREGKRINTHSLIIQGVQLSAKTEGKTVHACLHVLYHGCNILF